MRRAGRHAKDLSILRHGGEERFDDVGNERLLREVDQRVGRMQCLKQRAGIVPEDIGHFARRKARLDDVIAFGAPGRLSTLMVTFGCSAMYASASALAVSWLSWLSSTR